MPRPSLRATQLIAAFAVTALAATIAMTLVLNTSPEPVWDASPSPSAVTDAEQVLERCSNAGTDPSCLTEGLLFSARRYGPAAAFTAYDRLRVRIPKLAQLCHSAGHAAGVDAITRADGDLRTALRYLEPVCQSAYAHGVLDGWAHQLPDGLTAREQRDRFTLPTEICDAAAAGFTRSLCFDGVGHAALLYQGDYTDTSIESAWRLCAISDIPASRVSCAGGIVMQLFAPVGDTGGALPVDDIAAFCRALPQDLWGDAPAGSVRAACRDGAIYPILTMNSTPVADATAQIEKLLAACDELADPDDPGSLAQQQLCRGSIGYAMLYSSNLDLETAKQRCALAVTLDRRQSPFPIDLDTCVDVVDDTAASNG